MAKDRQFVCVISPAYIKRILDGRKCVIIYPGASEEELDKFRVALDDLKTKPDLSVMAIKPKGTEVAWVRADEVREIRGE